MHFIYIKEVIILVYELEIQNDNYLARLTSKLFKGKYYSTQNCVL